MRVVEIGIAEVRKILAGLAAGVVPSAVNIHSFTRVDDGNGPVAFTGIAVGDKVVENIRDCGVEQGIFCYNDGR